MGRNIRRDRYPIDSLFTDRPPGFFEQTKPTPDQRDSISTSTKPKGSSPPNP